MVRLPLICAMMALVLIAGCVGQRSEAECAPKQGADKANCFYDMAIYYAAVKGEPGRAVDMCMNIDAISITGPKRNLCVFKVAEITGNASVCSNIYGNTQQEQDVNAPYKNACTDIAMKNGNSGRLDLCAPVAPFVLLLAGMLFMRRKNSINP